MSTISAINRLTQHLPVSLYSSWHWALPFKSFRTAPKSMSCSTWPVCKSENIGDINPLRQLTKRTIFSSGLLQRTILFKEVGRPNVGQQSAYQILSGPRWVYRCDLWGPSSGALREHEAVASTPPALQLGGDLTLPLHLVSFFSRLWFWEMLGQLAKPRTNPSPHRRPGIKLH